MAFASSPLLLDLADRVVLVHGGTVVAAGAHRDLLRDEPLYRAVVTRETDDDIAASAAQDELVGADASPSAEAIEEFEERA